MNQQEIDELLAENDLRLQFSRPSSIRGRVQLSPRYSPREDYDAPTSELPSACYHGSSRPFAIGRRIKARCRPTEFGNRVSRDGVAYEEFVDSFRPAGTGGRECSVFMTKDRRDLNFAGADESFVYEVKPSRPVVRADFGWFVKLLGERRLRDNPKAVEYAKRYWSGEPVPRRDQNHHVFEFLAPAFTIKQRVKGEP